jgi:hypothetical protein
MPYRKQSLRPSRLDYREILRLRKMNKSEDIISLRLGLSQSEIADICKQHETKAKL